MNLPHHASEERDYIAMRTLTVVRQYLAAAFLLVIGLIAYGCGDSATVNPEATLSNLTVTIGTDTATLDPAFNPATTSYTVNLSNNITTVTVSAQAAVAGDSVTIDGQATPSRVIDLGQPVPTGSTTIVSITVSDPPNTPRTYTVLLRRVPLDGNNLLRSLTVSPGTLNPVFAAVTEDYTVDVLSSVGSIAITSTLDDANATMTVNGQAATSGQVRSVALNGPGSNTRVDIVVTAQNNTSKTYTILVNRGGLSSNNNLQNLTVSPGSLTPSFNPNLQSYTVDVPNTVGSVSVTPTRQDATATITVNGQAAPSGQARAVNLNPPGQPTTIQIVVSAQNGTQKTYFVTANRGTSSNNNLQNLTVSPGSLTPSFNPNLQSYTVDVPNTVGSVSVTPTRQDPNATITVNGTPATSGQGRSITLNGAGSNTFINIVVTAQNGTQKAYTVNVARAALGGNNNLQSLTVSPGTLNPAFNANTLNYTVDVASTVASITVTPTRQDPAATITVNGTPATSGQGRSITLNGAGSNTLINILVTAPNGSQKTYTVNVARAALGGNNNLSALTVSPGTLNPAFNANTTNYTVDVASSVASVTVTPTQQDPNATITVNGTPATSGQGRSITLNGAGSNTLINIVVTAPNGSQKNYTVNVSRAALGGNNNLQNLTVSPGTLNPTFRSDRIAYTVNVSSNVASLTVTATIQDTGATLTINDQGISSGQPRAIPLGAPGSTTEINVVVIAPNGNPKTYQIDVIREALGGNNNLSALTVAPGSLDSPFNANDTEYTVNVGSAVTTVTVTATLQDTAASMMINGQGTSSGQTRDISLGAEGSSTDIDILITAPNGSQKTYSITVNRAAGTGPPPTPTVAPDLIREDDSCATGVPPDECAPGTSKEDNITNVTRPRFSIPPPGAGETAKLYRDGVEEPSSFNSGNNTLRPNNPLPDGVYDITYTLSNSGGESGESPAMVPQLQIDTTGP
jgi:hypothetical protein